jgi:hypothetical protein
MSVESHSVTAKSSSSTSTESPQTQAEQDVAPAWSPGIARVFHDGRLSAAQRQNLVKSMGRQYGNRQVQRLLGLNKAAPTNIISHLPVPAIQRDDEPAEGGEEEAPQEELSGVITPTNVDQEPGESFCNDVASGVTPQLSMPILNKWIPQLPNIIKSHEEANRPPIKLNFNLSMGNTTAKPGAGLASGGAHAHDDATINSSVTVSPTTKNAGSVSATGEEIFGFASGRVFVDGDWKLSGSVLTVNATMNVTGYWVTSGLGRDAIFSAKDEKINESSWASIVYDLEVDSGGVPLRRKLYYAPAITKTHELYHVDDIFKQARTYIPTAKSWLDSQTVFVPGWSLTGPSKESMITFNLNTTLMELSFKVEESIKSYLASGGETRAYAAGKGLYDGLLSSIKDRAKEENWPLPKTPEYRESLGLKPGQKSL